MTQQMIRVLSQRTHRAHKEHCCENCEEMIFPGDLYEVTVTVIRVAKYSYVRARKEHVNPACPYPDPRDERDEDETAGDLVVTEYDIAA